MASTLMGATVSPGLVEAVYRYEAFGATKTASKSIGWSSAVTAAAAALVDATQDEAGEIGIVTKVQIYTPVTDPQGAPGFSAPGEQIDVTFRPGNSPESVRVGDDESVPEAMATARDVLKAAIEAEI